VLIKRDLAATQWCIIRPCAFFENVDDPGNWNPLKKGSVKMLQRGEFSMGYISTVDVGKGIAAIIVFYANLLCHIPYYITVFLCQSLTLLLSFYAYLVGKGVAAMLMDPTKYAGTTLDAVTSYHTGTDLAEVLTRVSGTKCR
jgi:hypothetical protein